MPTIIFTDSLQDLQNFQLAVENATDQIIITDPNGIVLYANKAIEEFTGFPREEILNKKAGHLWGRNMPREFYDNLWKTIKEDKKKFSAEILNKKQNGQEYTAELHIAPVLGTSGEIKFFIGIERDITKFKEIEREKTEIISLASHQLRTPLSVINWYIELLMGKESNGQLSSEQLLYLEEINKANKRMTDLVSSLLNVSRLELGTFSVEPKSTNLIEIIKESLEDLKLKVQEKTLEVKEDYDSQISNLNIDPKLTKIIIDNIVSNAIKYSSQNGHLEIKVLFGKKFTGNSEKDISNDVLIIISDTGCGIPKGQQGRVFDKLFRADNAVAQDAEGNGLGLYIVKTILDKTNGKIWFQSEEKKGSTFFITIPISGMTKKEGEKKLESV
jgi:PAS domain S-box-containing protein